MADLTKKYEWQRELGPDLPGEQHHGQGIPAWVKDSKGLWNFDRCAMQDEAGRCPLDQMRQDHSEFMMAPGLIYRLATPAAGEK